MEEAADTAVAVGRVAGRHGQGHTGRRIDPGGGRAAMQFFYLTCRSTHGGGWAQNGYKVG
jgi:hypothetical protein